MAIPADLPRRRAAPRPARAAHRSRRRRTPSASPAPRAGTPGSRGPPRAGLPATPHLPDQSAPSCLRIQLSDRARSLDYRTDVNGSKLNFWPPTLASAINPPFICVKMATPFLYLATAAAPLSSATALACAERFALPCLKAATLL